MSERSKLIAEILAKPYSRLVIPEPDGSFRAEIAEFSGCRALGDTEAEALSSLREAAEEWLDSMIERGQPIQPPFENEEYSGKFIVRLPRSLHRRIAYAARREGVSINAFVASALALSVGTGSEQSQAVMIAQTLSLPADTSLNQTFFIATGRMSEPLRGPWQSLSAGQTQLRHANG